MNDEELFKHLQKKRQGQGVELTNTQDYTKEAEALIKQTYDHNWEDCDCLNDKDQDFLYSMIEKTGHGFSATQDQVFWLRDINGRIDDCNRPQSG